MMNILVLIHEFPPVGGGGGRAAEDVCKQLVVRGHQITVLTAHIKGLPREEEKDGIRIIRIPSLRTSPHKASFVVMAAYILSGIWFGLGLIRQMRPDVLHVHFALPAGALGWFLSLVTGLPYVLTAHLGDVPGGVPEKTGRWFRWVYPFSPPIWRRAAKVAAVSQFTHQLILQHYPVDVEVIFNGVDLPNSLPSRLKPNHPPRIVFAGRFVSQKNPLQIISSLAALKDLDWECVMVGDGDLLEPVRQQIKAHQMEGRFTLTGWVTPQDVLDWFSKSDILFMPSRSEGLPVVGVQALANGLAVVASEIGGFLDIVEHGRNGFLVDINQPSRFAESLHYLLTDRATLKQFQQASLEKAAQFDIRQIAKQYERLFEEIVHVG